jgi:hypothetical protein
MQVVEVEVEKMDLKEQVDQVEEDQGFTWNSNSTVNTGGGGGAGGGPAGNENGGAGGSGIVIVRAPGQQDLVQRQEQTQLQHYRHQLEVVKLRHSRFLERLQLANNSST